MTTTPTAVGEKDHGVSVSQSGSAPRSAPSGSEPSAAVREAALRIIDPAAVNPGYRRNNETEAHWLARKQRRITAALKKADAVLALTAAPPSAEPDVVLAALIELERWVTEDSDCRTQAQRAAGRKALIAARAAIANSTPTQPVPAAKSESHNHSEKGT